MAIGRFRLTNIIFVVVVLGILVLLFWPSPSAKTVKAPKAAVATEVKPDVPVLLAQRYKALSRAIDISRVKTDVTALSSYPSRMVGYAGCDQAADYVEKQFKTIGIKAVTSEEFRVTVPIDEGSKIVIAGQEFAIYAL